MAVSGSVALAEDVDEEVVVWSRPFARFDDHWWTVAYEVIAPVSVDIGNERLSLPVRAWQMQALLHCSLVRGGNRGKEVGCRIEEASLRAMVPGGIAIADEVLADVADSLRGTVVQMDATAKGRIPMVDLEGLHKRTEAERYRAEARRILVLPIAGALNQDLASHQPGDAWQSKREPLLTIPTFASGMAAARVDWQMDKVDDYWVARAAGRGTVALPVNNELAGLPCELPEPNRGQQFGRDTETYSQKAGSEGFAAAQPTELIIESTALNTHDGSMALSTDTAGRNAAAEGVPTNASGPGCTVTPDQAAHIDMTTNYRLELNSISVVDIDLGYVTERIWSVEGEPARNVEASPVWSAGTLKSHASRPDVAFLPSGRIAGPGALSSPLPPWTSMAVDAHR